MFSNTNDRTIHFATGGVATVKLSNNEIRIHQDFDLSKDTKFSTRTLLILYWCVWLWFKPKFFWL